jgi:glyoxylase-like metal-dependent hydrolase (beta-lactamase superfamily II)
MKQVKLILGTAGYCYAKEHHAIKGGRKKEIPFNAVFALIKHPEKGWVLFDTGYTERFHEVTSTFPGSIYAKITKVYIKPEEEVKAQLLARNINPESIEHIIVSHFHADHVGGLKDFPNATFYCSKPAYNQVHKLRGLRAVAKGLLTNLLPEDFSERTLFFEDIGQKIEGDFFQKSYDLFGDESILIHSIPGHAAGQYAAEIKTNKGHYFLAADSAWLKKSYQEYALPNPIVKLFFDSWADFKDSLKRLQNYHLANPETIIIPTHCNETCNPLIQLSKDEDGL